MDPGLQRTQRLHGNRRAHDSRVLAVLASASALSALSVLSFVSFVAFVSFVVSLTAGAVNDTDWPSHDRDAGGQRFSPLKQITPSNVARLQTAWTFDTGATGIQVTPLVINGIMYVAAGKDILALEPETAKVIWKYTAPAAVSRRGWAQPARPGCG